MLFCLRCSTVYIDEKAVNNVAKCFVFFETASLLKIQPVILFLFFLLLRVFAVIEIHFVRNAWDNTEKAHFVKFKWSIVTCHVFEIVVVVVIISERIDAVVGIVERICPYSFVATPCGYGVVEAQVESMIGLLTC